MIDRGTLLESMRRDLRKIAPTLQAEDWSEADIAEISTLIRAHIAAGDDAALTATAKWLADRAWAVFERARAAYVRARAREVSVRHDEAAVKKMNKEWSRADEIRKARCV